MEIRNSGEIILRVSAGGKSFEHPLQSCSFGYSLNQIPIATCRLNAGVGLRSADLASLHQDGAASLFEMNEARIIARISGPYNSRAKKAWDDVGEVTLFEGRVSGVSPLLSRPAMSVEVTLIHWLGDLAFSAGLSEQVGHGSHASFGMQAVYGILGAGDASPSFISNFQLLSLQDSAKIVADLWGEAIHPAMLKLTKSDPLTIEAADQRCRIEPGDAGNDILRAALARFDGDTTDGRKPRSADYVPLKLNVTGTEVPDSIAQFIANRINISLGGRSLWEKLLELAGPLGFAVIPLIDHAMVAPVTLGLRKTYEKKIRLDDITVMRPERWNVRPIRSSVIIAAGMESFTGAASAPDSEDAEKQAVLDRQHLIGGCYVPEDGPNRGIVLLNTVPVWLSGVAGSVSSASRTSGEDAGEPGTAVGKGGKNPALRGNKKGRTPAEVMVDSGALYGNYARYLYVLEAMNHRNLLVVCPTLRLDIAPGSSVEVEGPFDEPLFGSRLFGTVARVMVSCQVTGNGLQMSTQLRLAGIRREQENEQDAFSLDEHPLYTGKQFLGTPLHDDLRFSEN